MTERFVEKKLVDGRSKGAEASPKPTWVKPPIEKELDEFPGHSKRLGIPVEAIVEAWNRAELQELDDEDWSRLQNCDSRDQDWTVEEVEDYRGKERDVKGINARFQNGEPIHAPVVLFRANHNPFLMGGNTRLMLCRTYKVRPMVLALHI